MKKKFKIKWNLIITFISITALLVFIYYLWFAGRSKSHEYMTPSEVVQKYLDIAFSMTDYSDKQVLMQYTTGTLNAALSSADEKTIKEAYIDRNIKIKSLSLIKKLEKTPREIEITFSIEYLDSGFKKEREKPTSLTVENTVFLIKENNKWMIRDVLPGKTKIVFPVTKEDLIIINKPSK